jgi:predicted SprT family Zn-dependent metalloprotease
MDKKIILKLINRESVMVWDSLCEIYPALVNFDCPKFELNGRLWRTAGMCYQEESRIELGYKFFLEKSTRNTMIDVILPHEIIHQADYNLFGDSEKNCGHGVKWCEIMVNYGLDADPYHTMDIKR